MSFKSRLRRVEEHAIACGRCRLAASLERVYAFYPDEGEPEPEVPACSDCGRPLGVALRVVYEGEGA
jgi:hypothetical protein